MTGYIYAIESGGRVKIGYSENPEKRFSKIASDAPFPCALLGSWPGTVSDELEVQAHFNAIRVHGEWFAATADLLGFIADNTVPRVPSGARYEITDSDNALAAWRKSQRRPMEEFAREIGVATSTWCTWETGKRPLPACRIRRVMDVTGLSLAELRPDIFEGDV